MQETWFTVGMTFTEGDRIAYQGPSERSPLEYGTVERVHNWEPGLVSLHVHFDDDTYATVPVRYVVEVIR